MWDLPSGAVAKTLHSQCRGQGPGVPALEGEPDPTATTKTRCTQINYVIKKTLLPDKAIKIYFSTSPKTLPLGFDSALVYKEAKVFVTNINPGVR